jgi:hypothetical protein
MSSLPLTPAVSAFDLTTSYQAIYTVPASSLRAGVDAVVFNNYSPANVDYSVRITQGGASTVLNEIITGKTVRALSNDLASAMIGQAILSGGTIEAKASVNSSINAAITVTLVNETF